MKLTSERLPTLPKAVMFHIMLWECMLVAHDLLQQQHQAATKIQALWRGHANGAWFNYAFHYDPWQWWMFDMDDNPYTAPTIATTGSEFPSDYTGDGPTLVSRPAEVTLTTHNASILGFRLSNMVEALDIQIWTYAMRLHHHDYVGQPFDYHLIFGSEEIFADFAMLQHLFRSWLRTDRYELEIPRALWRRCIDHFETFEVSEIFQDDRVTQLLQEIITDMIRLATDLDYDVIPRPFTEAREFVPNF